MDVRNENCRTFPVTGVGGMGERDVRSEDLICKDEISLI